MNERFLVESTVRRPKFHSQPLQTTRLPITIDLRPQSQYPYLRHLRSWMVIGIILCIAARSWHQLVNGFSIPPPSFWSYTPIPKSERLNTLNFWQRTRDASEYTNHALISSGAQIIRDLTSQTYDPRRGLFRRQFFAPIYFLRDKLLGFELSGIHLSLPRDAINDPNYRCWELEGRHGYIAIALSAPVSLTHVSIGRIPQAPASPERPKSVRVWGLVDNSLALSLPDSLPPHIFSRTGTIPQGIATRRFIRLADFQSSPNNDLHAVTSLVAGHGIDVLVFEVVSNHGGNFTCLYDLGAYGSRLHDHPRVIGTSTSYT